MSSVLDTGSRKTMIVCKRHDVGRYKQARLGNLMPVPGRTVTCYIRQTIIIIIITQQPSYVPHNDKCSKSCSVDTVFYCGVSLKEYELWMGI